MANIMINVISITIVLIATAYSSFPVTPNLTIYQQHWKSVAPPSQINELPQFSSKDELCGTIPCKFYYYIQQYPEIAHESSRSRTLLLVSGLKGNDYIGPNLLLNAYGKIKAARVIYFPVANPSGAYRGKSLTYPSEINVQKDFPLAPNQNCNRTAAVKILHHIFEKYPIDLTIYVHEGPEKVTFSWNRKYQKQQIKTQDYSIQSDIAEMLKSYGQSFQAVPAKIQTGVSFTKSTEDSGMLVDWVYGASHYPYILSTKCGNNSIAPQSNSKMKGLSLSLGIGLANQIQKKKQSAENYLQRGITMLKKAANILNPYMSIKATQKDITLTLNGCKLGVLVDIRIKQSESRSLIYQRIKTEQIVQGDVTGVPPNLSIITLPPGYSLPDKFYIQLLFRCDNDWMGKGKTSFGQTRLYTQRSIVDGGKLFLVYEGVNSITSASIKSFLKYLGMVMVAVSVVILAFFLVLKCIRGGAILKKTNKLRNLRQKFEHIEYIEDSEGMQEKSAPPTPKGSNITEKNKYAIVQSETDQFDS